MRDVNFISIYKKAKRIFPNMSIKYKESSTFMKILSYLLFFNKSFMTKYITTIGNTIYFPNKDYLNNNKIQSSIILLHELMHIYDSMYYGKYAFAFLYLFPQILFLLFIPLLFVSWKIALVSLIFLLPLPAYFRMYFEKRAYMVSLYVAYKLSKKYDYEFDFESYKKNILSQFTSSNYYFMWIFSLEKEFDDAILKIKNNERPFDNKFFNLIDLMI